MTDSGRRRIGKTEFIIGPGNLGEVIVTTGNKNITRKVKNL